MQQDKICEYLEKDVYTVMFIKRNDTLTREIQKQRAAESDLLKKQSSQSETKSAEAEIIPTTQHILDSYPRLSVAEKNSLWKMGNLVCIFIQSSRCSEIKFIFLRA